MATPVPDLSTQPRGKCRCCIRDDQMLFRKINIDEPHGYCIDCIRKGLVENETGLGFC